MINKIGVENFRVFREYTEFEIRPITLLTGPNNSGKSSFTKLLLLLQNGREQLDFKKGRHNLENYEKVLNWDNDSKYLRVTMNCPIPMLDDYEITYTYEDGNLHEVVIGKNDLILLRFYHNYSDVEDPEYSYETPIENHQELDLDLKLLIDLIYNNGGSTVEKSTAKTEDLNKDYLLYQVFSNGKDLTEAYKDEILKLQIRSFQDYQDNELLEYQYDNIYKEFVFKTLRGTVYNAFQYLNRDVKTWFEEITASINQEVSLVESPLGKILFPKNFEINKETSQKLEKSLLQSILNVDDTIGDKLNQLDFISATRGSQRRVLQNESDNEIDKTIVDYYEYEDKNIPFLQKVFEILKIEGKLIIERYQNSVSIVYLENSRGKIALADVGYGYSQIIPVILKIIMTPGTLIIEEPEANLHPALQSKLADILVMAIKSFPKKSFILETHSEYLIRKLQFLTASQKISPEDSVIYYFNSDEHVNHEEPKVKQIEITDTGNLTETFGPGFYDETTRLQFDLLQANQS